MLYSQGCVAWAAHTRENGYIIGTRKCMNCRHVWTMFWKSLKNTFSAEKISANAMANEIRITTPSTPAATAAQVRCHPEITQKITRTSTCGIVWYAATSIA